MQDPTTLEVKLELPSQEFESNHNVYSAAMHDFRRGAGNTQLWLTMAWEEFVQQYKRSYLGAIWAVLSFVIFTLAILFLVAAIRGRDILEMAPYVVFGILIFQLLADGIRSGSSVFISSRSWIHSARLPLTTYAFIGITKAAVNFVFSIIGSLIVLIWIGFRPASSVAFWAIPGLFALLVNSVWVYLLLGTLTSRIRDLSHLITATMRMAFFITPVMWMPVGDSLRASIAVFNPLTHFIDIIRTPLIYGEVPYLSWKVVAAITVLGYLVAFYVFANWRKRVPLWL